MAANSCSTGALTFKNAFNAIGFASFLGYAAQNSSNPSGAPLGVLFEDEDEEEEEEEEEGGGI